MNLTSARDHIFRIVTLLWKGFVFATMPQSKIALLVKRLRAIGLALKPTSSNVNGVSRETIGHVLCILHLIFMAAIAGVYVLGMLALDNTKMPICKTSYSC